MGGGHLKAERAVAKCRPDLVVARGFHVIVAGDVADDARLEVGELDRDVLNAVFGAYLAMPHDLPTIIVVGAIDGGVAHRHMRITRPRSVFRRAMPPGRDTPRGGPSPLR
jgi:hypothetical protein